MAKPLRPYVRGGGFYPSRKYTPLVYPGGYTTRDASIWPHDPLGTFSGAIARFHTIRSMPIKSLKVNMSPIQDLHGYDNPWPAGGGKNLCDGVAYGGFISNNIARISSTTPITSPVTAPVAYYGVCFFAKVQNGSTYAFSSDATGVDSRFYWAVYPTVEDATNASNVLQYGNTNSFTANNDGYVVFMRYNYKDTVITWTYAQAEIGSTATAFAPYSNVCPISGWDGVTVYDTGKNFADDAEFSVDRPSWYTGTYWLGLSKNADGTFTLARPIGWGGHGWVYIGTFKAGTYKLSFDVISTANVTCAAACAVKKKQTWVDGAAVYAISDITATGRYTFAAFTIIEDCDVWLAVGPYIDNGAQVISGNYQLELGSTASAYEPYKGDSYSVTFGETVYGAKPDLISGEMPVDIVSSYVTGEESEIYMVDGATVPTVNIRNVFPVNCIPQATYYHGSDRYKYQYSQATTLSDNSWRIVSDKWVIIADSVNAVDVDTFRAYARAQMAAGTPIQFASQVVTPIETAITPTPITALKGYNNVWSNAGPVEVTAYGTQIVEPDVQPLQAMNLLLGGAYRNNHTPEDVSDEEAFNIITGGADR